MYLHTYIFEFYASNILPLASFCVRVVFAAAVSLSDLVWYVNMLMGCGSVDSFRAQVVVVGRIVE